MALPSPPARPAEHLALLRIAVFGIWTGIVATADTALYARLPNSFFERRGVAELLPLEAIMGSSTLLMGLTVATIAGCIACMAGVRGYVPVAVVTSFLVLVHDAMSKSAGAYSNHAQSALLLVTFVVALFPAADAYSLARSHRNRTPWAYAAPLLASALLVTITYSFIGTRRIFVGGVEVFIDGSFLHWVVGRTLEYSAFDVSVGLELLANRWLVVPLSVGMAVVTLFETLSPLAVRSRRFRVAWLVAIVAFHVGTLLLMDIFFWENLVLIAVLFTGVPGHIVERIEGRRSTRRSHAPAVSP